MFSPGYVLANRYRLLDPIGKGGMGSVWRAEHIELGTPTAIKFMAPSLVEVPGMLARFKREAQAAAALRSSHVVQILDFGVDANTPYLAMELLRGEDLRQRLDRMGRLAPAELARFLAQAGKAIALAHDAGVVHRDLKPDNIFIAREGTDEIVKVLDFGVAKIAAAQEMPHAALTRTGAVLGTPYYMSPEQTHGRTTIDHRTDIWALAIIAFECLVGRVPYEAETLGALALAICHEPIPAPSSVAVVPPGFDEWFARGTARDPAQRFPSVREQVGALAYICGSADSLQATGDPSRTAQASSYAGPAAGASGAAMMGSGGGGVNAGSSRETASPASVSVAGSHQNRRHLPGNRSVVPWLVALTSSVALGAGGLITYRAFHAPTPSASSVAGDDTSVLAGVGANEGPGVAGALALEPRSAIRIPASARLEPLHGPADTAALPSAASKPSGAHRQPVAPASARPSASGAATPSGKRPPGVAPEPKPTAVSPGSATTPDPSSTTLKRGSARDRVGF